jgi:hypothetical protein
MKKATKLLKVIEGKKVDNADGTVGFPTLTNDEYRFMDKLTSKFQLDPVFTSDSLLDDFKSTMKSNGLLEKSEYAAFDSVKSRICLFATSLMHGCTIDLGNDMKGGLALADVTQQPIAINACVPGYNPGGVPILMGYSIFSTELDAKASCSADLFATPQPWDQFEIELTAQGVLDRLG